MRAFAFALLLLATSCGSLRSDGPAAAVGATASAAAALPTGTPAPGEARIEEDEEGWAMDVPLGWYDERNFLPPMHIVRSFDGKGSGLIPRTGGVAVAVQVMYDREGLDLETFADRYVWIATCPPCRAVREGAEVTVAGEPAKFFSVWQSQPIGLDALEPNLWWLVRSPFDAERILVIRVVPAATPLRPAIEHMVSTVQLFRPRPADLVPTKSRAQVIAETTGAYAITRVTAKATTWRVFEDTVNAYQLATDPNGPGRFRSPYAPETLVWVVAYTGSGFTPQKGAPGPPGPAGVVVTLSTPAAWSWGIVVVPARAPFGWGGPGFGGPQSTWPSWFDSLRDLAP